MSMAPGPEPPQPGTWEAPKWPPRAQLRRRCCPGRAEPGKGAGRPAGQPRATCHESSQPTMSRTRDHRAVGERRPRVADHADLHADAALVVNPGETVAGGGRRSGSAGNAAPDHGPADACVQSAPGSSGAGPAGPCVQSAPLFWSSRRLHPALCGPVLASSVPGGLPPDPARVPGRSQPGSLTSVPARCVGPAERPPGPDHRNELGDLTGERIPYEMSRARRAR